MGRAFIATENCASEKNRMTFLDTERLLQEIGMSHLMKRSLTRGNWQAIAMLMLFVISVSLFSLYIIPQHIQFSGLGIAVVSFFLGLLIALVYGESAVSKDKSENAMPSKEHEAFQPDIPEIPEEWSLIENNKQSSVGFDDYVTRALGEAESRELFPEIIGNSAGLRTVFGQILKAAPLDVTVLVMGESGTGKELVASSIHNHSLRKDLPFVKINCVSIPEGLLESELFGHEKGSFTSAYARKTGKFEIANGGTILLDEIGDLPLATQAKLLRVLQEKEFERGGGNGAIKVDVRFIAATNKNLPRMVKEGLFREDLFYRLNVFTVQMPPLRERREDIFTLVDHFLKTLPRPVKVSPTTMQFLAGYPWPGNVRELENIIKRLSVMTDNGVIEPHDLPKHIVSTTLKHSLQYPGEETSLDERLLQLEKIFIMEAIIKAGGVQTKAAQLLGIKERSLWHRVRKLDIDVMSIKKGIRRDVRELSIAADRVQR